LLDFGPLHRKETTIHELAKNLSLDDMHLLTNEMIDTMLDLISDCIDEDVTFVPTDPEAQDDAAATEAEVNMPWTLGHVIVHTTATGEESAFLAAELGRGVKFHGRSRFEVPWQTITTIAQCRERLEESRRMRLASLAMWPELPHLDNTRELRFLEGPVNAPAQFVNGLRHDDAHLDHIVEIVRQAKAARS
jgi:hypothetical protein